MELETALCWLPLAAVLLLAACSAEVTETGQEDPTSQPVVTVRDPCNRQGSGWEDVPGCLCAFECPEREGMTRICDGGECSYRKDEPCPAEFICDGELVRTTYLGTLEPRGCVYRLWCGPEIQTVCFTPVTGCPGGR